MKASKPAARPWTSFICYRIKESPLEVGCELIRCRRRVFCQRALLSARKTRILLRGLQTLSPFSWDPLVYLSASNYPTISPLFLGPSQKTTFILEISAWSTAYYFGVDMKLDALQLLLLFAVGPSTLKYRRSSDAIYWSSHWSIRPRKCSGWAWTNARKLQIKAPHVRISTRWDESGNEMGVWKNYRYVSRPESNEVAPHGGKNMVSSHEFESKVASSLPFWLWYILSPFLELGGLIQEDRKNSLNYTKVH